MDRKLNPLLHNELRISILSLLISMENAEFGFLLDKTGATKGNLSVQITKLKDAGLISVKKTFRNNYPLTICKITRKGVSEFEKYVATIKALLNLGD